MDEIANQDSNPVLWGNIEYLSVILDSMNMAVHIIDQNFAFKYVNQRFIDWYKSLNLEYDVIGKTLFDVYPWLGGKVREEYLSVLETGTELRTWETTTICDQNIHTHSIKYAVKENEEIIGVLTIIDDVSEKEVSYNQLAEKEKFLRNITNNLPYLNLTIINRDMSVAYSAGKKFDNLDIDPKNFVGLTVTEYYEKNPSIIEKQIEKAFSGEEVTFQLDADDRHLLFNCVPFSYIDKKVDQVLVVVRNETEKIKIQLELFESESRYRMLFENTMVGVGISTPDGRLLHCNEALSRLMGYDREKFSEIDIRNLYVNIEDRETFLNLIDINGSVDGFEVELLKTDKSKFWGSMSSRPINFLEEKVFLTSILDITKKTEAEKMLQDSEERYEMAMSVVNDGIWDWHLDTGNEYKDERYYIMAGYEPHEYPGDTQEWRDRIHPEDMEFATQAAEDYLAGKKEKYDLQFRFRRKDGSYMWIRSRGKIVEWDEEGKPKRFVGTHSDITEKIKAEQNLKDSEQRFRALHNASFGGIAIHDKGMILECNSGLSEITGFSYDELIGMNGLLLISEDTRELVVSNINSSYEEPYEAIGVRKNGEEYPVQLEARQIPYKGKNVRVVEFRDMTERMEAEQRLQTNEDKLNSIFRVAPTGIGMVKNRVLFEVNPKICEMTGYSKDELIGQPAMFLYPTKEEYDYVGDEKYRLISEHGTGAVETLWKCKDGRIINVYLASTPINVDDLEKGVTFTALDISESKKEENLLRAISLAGIEFAKVHSQDEIFSVIGETFMEFGYDCVILLLNKTQELFSVPYLTFNKDLIKTIRKVTGIRLEDFEFPYGENEVYQQAIHQKETVFIDKPLEAFESILKNPLGKFMKSIIELIELKSGILAPLIVNEDVIGVLYIQADNIQAGDRYIFSTAANQIAAALHKARLFEQAENEISERKLTEQLLLESESQLLEAQEVAVIGSYSYQILDDKWTCSTVLAEIFGIDDSYQKDFNSWLGIIHREEQTMMMDYFQNEIITKKQKFDKEYRIISLSTKKEKWVHGLGSLRFNEQGELIEMFGTIQDITERKISEAQLKYMATHDSLTDLPNRNTFETFMARAIQRSQRDGSIIGLLFIDIDNFKSVNDAFGHNQGDQVLKQLTERLVSTVRTSDTVARFGGDEFVILLENIPSGEDVLPVAEKIIEAISLPLHVEGSEVFITASIGISLFPSDGKEVSSLLSYADQAMYQAKESGKNSCQYYSPEMSSKALDRLELKNQLRLALTREEFVLHYQPQVDISSNKLIGVEALVRWNHPEKGLIYPGSFLGLAEESGLIIPLGVWVLREACKQLKAWLDAGYPNITMAINFSERELTGQRLINRHLLTEVKKCVDDFKIPPQLIELELSEKIVFQKIETALPQLQELHEFGVKLAIDDFGVGNSTLSQLGLFPFDTLKVDKYFANRVNEFSSDAAVVRGIVAIARNLGLNIVVEGVETKDQLIFYNASGCQFIQGWYYSKPVPPQEIEKVLKAGGKIQTPDH